MLKILFKNVLATAVVVAGTFSMAASTQAMQLNLAQDAELQENQNGNQVVAQKLNVVTNWLDEGNFDTGWYNEALPVFEISEPAQLAGLANLVNQGHKFIDKTIILKNNINMSGHIWTPIGIGKLNRNPNTFCGTFDGNHKIISNITTLETENTQGLFGDNKGIIKNIIIINSDIRGLNVVGGIAAHNRGKIQNSANLCSVRGTEVVGGVVGSNSGEITQSYNKGQVAGKQKVGGIAGSNSGQNAKIINVYNIGHITGDGHDNMYIGGIAGYNGSSIECSYNVGSVEGAGSSISGISGSQTSFLKNNYYCIQENIENIKLLFDTGTAKTSDEMKNLNNLPRLKKAFINSPSQEINNNYPILKAHIKQNRNYQKHLIKKFKNAEQIFKCNFEILKNYQKVKNLNLK